MQLAEKKGSETVEPKDEMRIRDMVTKSAGSKAKLVALAKQMAKSITDVDKATRRAKAAEAMKLTDVANEFYARAIALGKKIVPESLESRMAALAADMRLLNA